MMAFGYFKEDGVARSVKITSMWLEVAGYTPDEFTLFIDDMPVKNVKVIERADNRVKVELVAKTAHYKPDKLWKRGGGMNDLS